KCCHQYVTAGPDGALNLADVSLTIGRVGEEMEHGAIMPDCVSAIAQRRVSYISGNPLDSGGRVAEALPRSFERRLRHVEHGHVRVAGSQKVVDEHRGTASNIDDWSGAVRCEAGYEIEGFARLRLEPADGVDVLRPIDRFPMLLLIHR